MTDDPSNGYEAVAAEFMKLRSETGAAVVKTWAGSLRHHATVLDIGCGHGYPLTPALLRAGVTLSAIDASPKMVAAFKQNFPDVRVACEAAEESDFFGETFDAILSVGLMFLLPEKTQIQLIPRIAAALKPKGRFLFSAPKQKCDWVDVLTGQTSWSLGADRYAAILNPCGLTVTATHTDAGGSHYYEADLRGR